MLKKRKPEAVDSVPRNQIPLLILSVLFDHANGKSLSRREIEDALWENHEITLDRTAVTRNLKQLEQVLGRGAFPMLSLEQEGTGNSKWRWKLTYESDFDSAEVRFLLDAVSSFYSTFPALQSRHYSDLVDKLNRLAEGQAALPSVGQPMDSFFPARQLLSTIDLINEAIRDNLAVSFYLNSYGPDKKLYHGDKRALVRPLQLFMHKGRYYLLARYVHPYPGCEEKNYHYRVDFLTDVEIEGAIDKKTKYLWPDDLIGNKFNLVKYLAEHEVLWSDAPENIRFLIRTEHCGWAIDKFGGAVNFRCDLKGDYTEATVRTSPEAIKRWALAHPDDIEVLEPASLRESIREAARKLLEKYGSGHKAK